MNRVYLFHNPGEDGDTKCFLLRKRKRKIVSKYYYLAVDELTITDENKTSSILDYFCPHGYIAATLTRREADLISLSNPGVRPPAVLEEMYPWLPKCSYVPDSKIGYRALSHVVKKYNTHFISVSAYCDVKWNSICNKLRQKTSFDKRFQVAWGSPVQEVFLLEEKRPERSVVTIDVNAMYSSCMQHDIPNPATIRKVGFHRNYKVGEKLLSGLYRCQLSGFYTEFIQRYNPFTMFFCGRRVRPSQNETLEIDLNEFEVEYFSMRFERIYISDAVVSDTTTPHPLAREARRAFSRRRNYHSQQNKPLANREKYLATLLASCGSRPRMETKIHSSRSCAMRFLSNAYGILPPADEPEEATNTWINKSKRFSMFSLSEGVVTIAPMQKDNSTCYMLSQRIVAHGRIHILKLMERILSICSMAEICYVNVDSIHFSVPNIILSEVMDQVRAEASDEMGSFKVETLTKHGLWLEPGRYWLYTKEIEKVRNRSIGPDLKNPFKDHAFHVASREINKLYIPIRVRVRMDKSMSHMRYLYKAEKGIVRQKLIERNSVTSFSETLNEITCIRKKDALIRLKAFNDLKLYVEKGSSAASELPWDPTSSVELATPLGACSKNTRSRNGK